MSDYIDEGWEKYPIWGKLELGVGRGLFLAKADEVGSILTPRAAWGALANTAVVVR